MCMKTRITSSKSLIFTNMDTRRFKIFYKVNISDEYPGEHTEVKTSDYVKIKHNNVNFALNFLLTYFKNYELYSEENIQKLWISIDDVEYSLIYDVENLNNDGSSSETMNKQIDGSAVNLNSKINETEKNQEIVTLRRGTAIVEPFAQTKSDVWQHFEKVKGTKSQVKCNHCSGLYESCNTTSNLRQHLLRKHPIIYPDTKKKNTVTGKKVMSVSLQEQHSKKGQKNQVMNLYDTYSSYQVGGSKYDLVTEAILFFICSDLQCLSVVEGKGFQFLLKILRSSYPVPSRKRITELLDLKYEQVLKTFKKDLQDLENYCLTADLWTDNSMNSYFGITIHYLNEKDEMDKGVLGVFPLSDRSTSEYIKDCIEKVMSEFGLSEQGTSLVVTDEGANISKAVDNYFGQEKHLPCAVHVVSHIIPDTVAELPMVDNILKKIKSIVTSIKRSSVATKKLEKLQNDDSKTPLKIIQDIDVRFTAKKEMVERFLELEKYLHAATAECKHPPEMLTRAELQIINEIYPCMKAVCEVINDLSGDTYPTCSLIIPSINCMIGIISEFNLTTEEGKNFKLKVLEKAAEKLKKFERKVICTVSTLLDPRFKRSHNQDIGCVTKAIQYINNLLRDPKCKVVEKEKKIDDSIIQNNSIWSYHERLKNDAESHYSSKTTTNIELKQFLDQARIEREESAVRYWKLMDHTFPLLHKIGRKYTSLVGTSIPSERVFSLAGLIKTDLRNRLTGEHLNRLVFLGSIKSQYWNLCDLTKN